MKNIVLFGKPGSGKGTQASLIEKKYNYVHISTGDVFRNNINQKTQLGLQAKKFIDSGDLVHDNLTIKMLEDKVENYKTPSGFIFDGFPRTIGQADGLINMGIDVDLVIEIALLDEIIISRMSGRRIHLASGRSYHVEFNPPKVDGKDDLTGEDLIQRDDDKPKTVLARIEVYKNQTDPLIDYYQDLEDSTNLRYLKIDGSDSPDAVSKEILKNIENF